MIRARAVRLQLKVDGRRCHDSELIWTISIIGCSDMSDLFQGSCLCGAVRYETSSRPTALSHCHCSQCRKSHGAAFASYGCVLRTDLHIMQGTGQICSYSSSDSVLRQFCSQCGSSLFWMNDQGKHREWISIALGTLDTPLISEKQQHIEVASKASWYEIQDHWPQSQ
jgi:hypothetical protein